MRCAVAKGGAPYVLLRLHEYWAVVSLCSIRTSERSSPIKQRDKSAEPQRARAFTLVPVEFSMCDISARMHCLAERRSKIGQTVTGKYANAMRVSNSIAAVTAPRPESSEETRASLSPRFPPRATEPSDESYVAPSGQ
ncbi:hypothetical protein HPB50_018122 [Hyalomma asiaticum]|uniref:Uncharacterized protein n=1 Tax=Hyalomma asiaticum TaxID=266040 RepID=A0ACB7T3B0_HYAAI|nr:hypothetical protein HPB50_018122 [Hyalomma asiaticum]